MGTQSQHGCLGSFLFPALIRLGIYGVMLDSEGLHQNPEKKAADRLYPHVLHTIVSLPLLIVSTLSHHWNNLLNSGFPLIPPGLGS